MKVTSTKTHSANRLKFLIYGAPGVGKTTLAATLNEPVLVISAEAGLLSLAGHDIDVVDITVDDDGNRIKKEHRLNRLLKVLAWLEEPATREKYKWIFIDSLTEISENLIENLRLVYPDMKDGLKLWGDYAKKARSMVKAFRDIPHYNVVFTALEKEDKDENNRRYVKVDMSGKIGQQLPAFFDEVFWFHVEQISKTETRRLLLTSPRENVIAKDRSGKLELLEPPNLQAIVDKIWGKNAQSSGRRNLQTESATQTGKRRLPDPTEKPRTVSHNKETSRSSSGTR